MNNLYIMVIIANRHMNRTFADFFTANNLPVVFAAFGKGTASNAVLDYLGLEEHEKVLYFSIVTPETWKKAKKELQMKIGIDIPGIGIAFTIPLSSIGNKKTLDYLTCNQTLNIEEESTLQNTTYELLIAIANAGYTDLIMDAARSASAPGGTVVHAKGTGRKEARKFLGISLADEKEMIFMVVKSDQKNPIMKAIMDKAGTGSPAGSIVFSLPVVSTAGLRLLEEDLSE